MSRIHPSSENKRRSYRQPCDHDNRDNGVEPTPVSSSPKPTTLTVWKRSSMSFQGTDGFTVYDRHGRLAFRVDNYSRNSHAWSCSSLAANGAAGSGGGGALVLMDGSGKPLITLKPQAFSIQNQWNGCVYREDESTSSKSDGKLFMMRRPALSAMTFGRKQNQEAQCEAEVFFSVAANEHQNHPLEPETGGTGSRKPSSQPDYRIEGSFWNRNCKIRSTGSGEVAARIMRKKMTAATTTTSGSNSNGRINSTIMLSEEVFSLVVNPGFDPQIIMAFVVILDRICFKPFFTHVMCL